ncbi:Bug family tripartite tricarboxylate transporter substrate binding protein [Noviherbaspirillum malthae]|uniref:Bug family tripartite tricarboxylate transporter substrate binding protein n=1 Tax=Noviherbaspirillum malthae TaxID=1260987 RepID=UPI00188FEB0D|nr:tripartite tricarboxylate transporter substrate binding protein [Noviherbaspirillum malthae]
MKLQSLQRLIGVVMLSLVGTVGAQNYPTMPVKIYVPIPPGGAPDIAARVISQQLSEVLKQPIVVENKPGANGMIAGDAVAKSAPDGHTLLLTMDSTIVVNPHLFKKQPYNPQTDLIPIASIASNQFVLAINPALPVKSFDEFIEYAKKAKPPLYYASGGNGSQHHLTMELLKQRAGITLLHVPYKGGAAATVATVSGETSVMFAGSSNAGQIKSGKLRAIAVTSKSRTVDYPGVPAIAESYPGFESRIWLGLFAPSGTPSQTIERLRSELVKILKRPDVKERFNTAGGMDPFITTPEEFDDLMKNELEKYGRIVKYAHIKLD